MHGTITLRPAYDRAEIARRARAIRREEAALQAWFDAVIAEELAHHAGFIDAAATEAERARRIACVTARAKPLTERPDVRTWGECMKAAWREAKNQPREMTEIERRRFFAEMSDDDTVRRRELRRIAEDEAALANGEVAHV